MSIDATLESGAQEEVVVGKQVSVDTKQIDDTVRRTDVEVLRDDDIEKRQ